MIDPSRTRALVAALAWITIAGSAAAQNKPGSAALTALMDDYLTKMLAHRTSEIKLAPDALLFLNTHPSRMEENPLARVRAIKSRQIFCDSETGNVIARTGVELEDGKIAYASTRLRVADRTITEVETSFDNSANVVPSYVTFLDPLMTTVVPPTERMSRGGLKAVVERYFQALTDHKASASDFDDRCDRYHSGQRITNNPRFTVEGGSVVTCFTALGGSPPWGPATGIRIPLVDPEHGIVAGYTVLLYQDGTAPMYVSEIFKILEGKIRMIDNIGLKAEGVQAMNIPQ